MKKKILSVLLVFLMLFGSLQPSAFAMEDRNGLAPSFVDPYEILQRLSGLGNRQAPSVPDPMRNVLPSLPETLDAGVPTPPGAVAPNLGGGAPSTSAPESDDAMQHPVDVATGQLKLHSTDVWLPGIGFNLELERSYDGSKQEPGAFGIGWNFNWQSQLRMYADFAMGEFRADGTVSSYTFVTDDPDGYILEYDGDDKVNYELHKGHYEPANGGKLERISQFEYVVKLDSGAQITYWGLSEASLMGSDICCR